MEFARQYPVKILAGIVLLSSARMAQYMTNNVPGIFVPQHLIDELADAVAGDAPKGAGLAKGIEIAGRLIKEIRENGLCDGVHIMAINKEEVVPDILAAAGMVA
jgi:methylenetetrahydrofolate reductase (NADPH)